MPGACLRMPKISQGHRQETDFRHSQKETKSANGLCGKGAVFIYLGCFFLFGTDGCLKDKVVDMQLLQRKQIWVGCDELLSDYNLKAGGFPNRRVSPQEPIFYKTS